MINVNLYRVTDAPLATALRASRHPLRVPFVNSFYGLLQQPEGAHHISTKTISFHKQRCTKRGFKRQTHWLLFGLARGAALGRLLIATTTSLARGCSENLGVCL